MRCITWLLCAGWLAMASPWSAAQEPPSDTTAAIDRLLGEGHALEGKSQTHEALKAFEDAKRQAQEAHLPSRQVDALLGIGNLHILLDNNEEARNALEKAQKQSEDHVWRTSEADAWEALGRLDKKEGDTKSALLKFKKAEDLYGMAGSILGKARVQMSVGDMEITRNNHAAALKHLNAALKLFADGKDRRGEANTNLALAILGQDKAAPFGPRRANLDAARTIYEELGYLQGQANVAFRLGELEAEAGNRALAAELYDKAETLYTRVPNALGLANVLVSKANLLLSAKPRDTAAARTAFHAAQEKCSLIKERLCEAQSLVGLATLNQDAGSTDDAIEQYRKAAHFFEKEEHNLGLAEALDRLGHIALRQLDLRIAAKDFDDASQAFERAGRQGDSTRTRYLSTLSGWVASPLAWTKGLSIIAAVAAIFLWLRHALRGGQQPPTDTDLPASTQSQRWNGFDTADAPSLVFVHGVLSGKNGYLDKATGTYWPTLVKDDHRFQPRHVFVPEYYTGIGAGPIGIPEIAEELAVQLAQKDGYADDARTPPLDSDCICFVAHSMGGLVVRQLLTTRPDLFKNKLVGLVLVASPSRGSRWANWLWLPIALANNRAGRQLQRNNDFVDNLDKYFARYARMDASVRGFELVGADLFESHFILAGNKYLGWLAPWLTVVAERHATSFFGGGALLPGTDHFSIVKPNSRNHVSHTRLLQFWQSEFAPLVKARALRRAQPEPSPA